MAPIREELEDWLRIPSVSTGGGDAAALGAACDWVLERIQAAGGSAERLSVVSARDNLVKGAAGQAIQCANLMYGLPEEAGVPGEGVYP